MAKNMSKSIELSSEESSEESNKKFHTDKEPTSKFTVERPNVSTLDTGKTSTMTSTETISRSQVDNKNMAKSIEISSEESSKILSSYYEPTFKNTEENPNVSYLNTEKTTKQTMSGSELDTTSDTKDTVKETTQMTSKETISHSQVDNKNMEEKPNVSTLDIEKTTTQIISQSKVDTISDTKVESQNNKNNRKV